jgi:predicted metal-dependent HD superfamily phosphohydrolase
MISPERLQGFEQSWLRLMEKLAIEPRAGFVVFDQLVAAYSASDRFYHNLEHLSEMFRVAGRLMEKATDPLAIQLAIWFHDAVYDSKAKDNEARSAEWAIKSLSPLGVSEDRLTGVATMIRATQKHAPNHDVDVQILLDADLAILGAEAKRYDRFALDIRREYAWVSDAEYQQGRGQVLQHFLNQERIYQTALLHEMGDAPARENLKRELEMLRSDHQ